MSLPEHARAALIEFRGRVERLVPGRLVGFRAFGSYVRGEAHEDSDLDVLVLVEALARDEHRSIIDAAVDVSLERNYEVDIAPLVLTPEGFDLLVRRERRIARDILAEGIVP